jgi:hypothetical protein
MPVLSRLFREKCVSREMASHGFKDEPFRLKVSLCDQIRLPFVGDLSDPTQEGSQEGAGFDCDLVRNGQFLFPVHDRFPPCFAVGYHEENRLTRKSAGINK